MGCDYYTITALKVCYTESTSEEEMTYYYELNRDRGYFMDYYGDSDESDYEEKSKKHYKRQYETNYTPITIYNNSSWSNPKYESKYSEIFLDVKNRIPKDAFIVSIIKIKYTQPR
jgi:hypothetical protein